MLQSWQDLWSRRVAQIDRLFGCAYPSFSPLHETHCENSRLVGPIPTKRNIGRDQRQRRRVLCFLLLLRHGAGDGSSLCVGAAGSALVPLPYMLLVFAGMTLS